MRAYVSSVLLTQRDWTRLRGYNLGRPSAAPRRKHRLHFAAMLRSQDVGAGAEKPRRYLCVREHIGPVEHAVKAERASIRGSARALKREFVGQRLIGPLELRQPRPIAPAQNLILGRRQRKLLRMRGQKIDQGLRTNAETAIADIETIAIPPGRPDVIAMEKLRAPHRRVDDPAVPLNE